MINSTCQLHCLFPRAIFSVLPEYPRIPTGIDIIMNFLVGDWRVGISDWGLATRDWRLGIGDWRLGIGEWGLATGDWGLGNQ